MAPMSADAAAADDGSTDGVTDAAMPPDLLEADLGPRIVEGNVLDSRGFPVSGFTVAIGPAQALTDSSGAFTLAASQGANDVIVAGTYSMGQPLVVQYFGLTRSDPTLRVGANLELALPNKAKVSATFSGIVPPTTSDVSFITSDLDPSHGVQAGFVEGDLVPLSVSQLKVDWQGASTQISTMRVLYAHPMGDQLTVLGYAAVPFTVMNGVETKLTTPAPLTVPLSATLSATVGPSATPAFYFTSYLDVGGMHVPIVSGGIPHSGALAAVEPIIDGATIDLELAGRFGHNSCEVSFHGLAPSAALGNIPFPSSGDIAAIAGAPGAVARNAAFSYLGAGTIGPLHVFTWKSGIVGLWQVVTASTTAQFPDATVLGVANPATKDRVYPYIAEYATISVDEAAGPLAYRRRARDRCAWSALPHLRGGR